jgi:hypothetical protein
MDVRNSRNNGRRRGVMDVPELIETLSAELGALWSVTPAAVVLSQSAPRFTFAT